MEGYNDEENEGTEDASMRVEAPLPDLQVIMNIIQALASTVTSLQIRQAEGKTQVRATRRRPAPAIQAPEATLHRQPTPVDAAWQPQAAPYTLAALGAAGVGCGLRLPCGVYWRRLPAKCCLRRLDGWGGLASCGPDLSFPPCLSYLK